MRRRLVRLPTNVPRLELADLLRRRRMNLTRFIEEFGIVSYEGLKARCASIGVEAPGEAEFIRARGGPIPKCSSPSEGIVVVEVKPRTSIEQTPVPELEASIETAVSSSISDELVNTKRAKRRREPSSSDDSI